MELLASQREIPRPITRLLWKQGGLTVTDMQTTFATSPALLPRHWKFITIKHGKVRILRYSQTVLLDRDITNGRDS